MEFNGLNSQPLFEKKYVLLCNKNHPLVHLSSKRPLLRGDLLRYKQIRTSLQVPGKWGNTIDVYALGRDELLRSPGTISTAYFLSVPFLLEGTNCYAITMEPIAEYFARLNAELVVLPMPKGCPDKGMTNLLIWSDQAEHSTELQWLRSLLLTESLELKNK